ncbi:hypothetical protein CFIMG_005170RA [Ceratocystis fimbriata CBS 114723]|uniref:SUR7 family protein pun1 n=1 Tax=Ceratocystis fimbriata CBS 114723 TaxID=1035309 RepID=A0A2C5X063_9PEZI|nr:hypothetical protein CFIMG_005170RA [Ceratocystis fimbriata CBS 114723]
MFKSSGPKLVGGRFHLIYLLPFFASMAVFIMSMMCALAGTNKGVLEEMAVIRINTSRLGYFLVPSNSSSDSDSDQKDSKDNSILDDIIDSASNIADDAKDKLSEIGSDIVDKLADELGISQWYSLHLVSACQGNFSSGGLKTDNCTEARANFRFNLTSEIDKQLSVGPLNLSLADIGFSTGLANGVARQINHLLPFVFFVFMLYMTGSILACFTMALSGALVFLDPNGLTQNRRAIVFRTALVCSAASSVSLGSGLFVTWFTTSQVAQVLTDFGDAIGLSASSGKLFLRMSLSCVIMIGGVCSLLVLEQYKPKMLEAKDRMRSKMSRKNGQGQEYLRKEYV